MSEGPSIVFLKNKLNRFKNKPVTAIAGLSETENSAIANVTLLDVDSFGQQLLFIFKDFFLSVQLETAGSMLVNKRKNKNPGFALHFEDAEINFYGSKTELHKGKPTDYFDYKTDVLKNIYDGEYVLQKLQVKNAEISIGEALLDQKIFSGVGHLIQTESLYRAKIHPASQVKNIPEKKLVFLIETVVNYAYEFLDLLKFNNVEEKALIFGKKICPKDKKELLEEEMANTGGKISVCPKCQKLFH